MSSMLTASIWGQGRAASALSARAARDSKGYGEECQICRDDVPATVAFVPCKHKVCFGCVENMRAKVIFKADKGIKCPFCRQYVDAYRSTVPDVALQKFLADANKAAEVAAQARNVVELRAMGIQPAQQAAAPAAAQQTAAGGRSRRPALATSSSAGGGAVLSGEDQQWHCGSCGAANYIWRDFCAKCKRPNPNPYGSDKLSQTRKDLRTVSQSELLTIVHQQGAYGLRSAFKDMGVYIDSHKSSASADCIRQAVTMYGLHNRVLHVVSILCDKDTLRDASLHRLGNLAVQRSFESMAKLRTAYADRPNQHLKAFETQHGSKDPFAALMEAMIAHILEYCLHDKGVYVAQTAANMASNAELVALAEAVFPHALSVSRDPRGVFVLLTLLDLLSQRIWGDERVLEPALQAVDHMCNQFAISLKQLVHTAHHALSGKVLVRAIAMSMPRFPAAKLAVKIAAHASTLVGSPGGLFTLIELVQLYGHNHEASEGLRDMITTMCYSLLGQIPKLALSNDAAAQELLFCIVERLGYEQEVGWLNSMAQELVETCDTLLQQPLGHDLLACVLTQPGLDLDTVTAHLCDMKGVLDKKQLLELVAKIMKVLTQRPEPSAPKYPAASAVQPELKYYVSQGWSTPPAPPPPACPKGILDISSTAAQPAQQAKVVLQPAAAAAATAAAHVHVAASSAVQPDGAPVSAAGSDSPADTSARSQQHSPNGQASSTQVTASAADGSWCGSSTVRGATAADPWSIATSALTAGISSGLVGAPEVRTVDSDLQQSMPAMAAEPPAATAPTIAATAAQPAGNVPGARLMAPVAAPIAVPVPTPAPAAAPPAGDGAAAATALPAAAAIGSRLRSQPAPSAAPVPAAPTGAARPRSQPSMSWQRRAIVTADFSSAGPTRLSPGANPGAQQPASQPAGAVMQEQQLQQRQIGPWSCEVCTFEHTGPQVDYLYCVMCSAQRPPIA